MPPPPALATEHFLAGRFDDAEGMCRALVEREPTNVEALHLLGRVLRALGRPLEAREAFRRAVEIEPHHADAQLDLGLVSLLLGDFAAGWRGYEWRKPATSCGFDLPRWDGSDPRGRTILVACEDAVEDCIHFARYLPLLTGRGATVVLTCPTPLVRLFGSLPNVCVITNGDPPPRADAWLPIGSLPLAFGTTPATIPTFAAYLRAAAHVSAAWRERVRPLRAGAGPVRLVGLAWGDGPVGRFARLARVPGIRLIALQPLPRSAPPELSDFSAELRDYTDTAALISQLDLAISTSTPIAHLAGAVGKPCWALMPHVAEWHWGQLGGVSAWYPSVQVFRAERTVGDGALVLEDVVRQLVEQFAITRAGLAA
jgi:tetratricopeptide (TPR) repeat protein